MKAFSRRTFLATTVGAAATAGAGLRSPLSCFAVETNEKPSTGMRFGLVTYMWGADWDLPTLLVNCAKAKALGVELRSEHAHHVEPDLNAAQRSDVKKRFADSAVTLIGLGTNQAFHDPDPAVLKQSIDRAKTFLKLSHDVGGSGVKVKPNDLPKSVPQEKTIEQIGRSLNELGSYAADLGQQVRLEVHGQCQPLPIIADIMEVANHPSVAVCWNSNADDLKGDGLEHNFHLVEKRLGDTTHVRDLGGNRYPYGKLFKLLKGVNYKGWVLIEASDKPTDYVAALAAQQDIFQKLVNGDGTG